MSTHIERLAHMGDQDAQLALARQQYRRADHDALDAAQAAVIDLAISIGQWLAVYPSAASYWLCTNIRYWLGVDTSTSYSWEDCVFADSRCARGFYDFWVFFEATSWHCVWVRLLHHLRYALRDTWPGDPP